VDTDFTAALVDVFPSGYAHLIQEGITRASLCQPDREPASIEPGRVRQYTIDLWATSFVIKAGHQIRVEVSSSNFNRYDRNPNTGEPLGTALHPISAHQRVFHTTQYPSHITLPIVP
jgi:putative CocE/NonD family hydrolase